MSLSDLARSVDRATGSNTRFARRTLASIGALLLLAFALIAAILVKIAHSQNQQALTQSLFFAEKALKARQENQQRVIGDYAFWGDAYQHLHARVDPQWAYVRRNLGGSLFEDFAYEGVFVIAADNRTTYAVIEGQRQSVSAEQWLQGDLAALLARARALAEQEQSTVAVFKVGERPALVAAAAFTQGGDPTVPKVAGPPSVLLFVDVLSPAKLLALGDDYALAQLRLARDTEDVASEPGLELATTNATPLRLRWDPLQPGDALLAFLLPLLAIAALIVTALSWLVMRHRLATAHLLDDSYATLVASEARFLDIAEASSDWLWETDAAQRLSYLSGRFEAITGHAPQAWLGRPLSDLLKFEADSLGAWLAGPQVQTNLRAPLRCSYRAASGKLCLCELIVCSVPATGGYRGTASDITADLENHSRIRQLQRYDSLTGLPNRNHLEELLEQRLQAATAQDEPLILLSISLQRFKQVNDHFGRTVGDQLLQAIAQRLELCLRDQDLLGRHTGDEFSVLLNGDLPRHEDIDQLCRRLVEHMERPFLIADQEVSLSIRIGIAQAPFDAKAAHELLRCADIALYQARSSKHSDWCFFTREMELRISAEQQLIRDLRLAIGNGELRLHFQPRYRTRDLHLSGVEALVRWQHPQRGLLSPGTFIPLAERAGLIDPLGAWVLQQACRQAMTFPVPIFVSVNLSPEQFRNPALLAQVRSVLAESGLPASRLELEITEGMLLDDAQGALTTLDELKALGVRLSMDDFGTGYSSLAYLRNYPFDTLKIDRSFIARLGAAGNDNDLAILQAIVWLGHALSMRVTAEGVESTQQLALLDDIGCDEIQGFHLSQPLPLERLHEHMTAAR